MTTSATPNEARRGRQDRARARTVELRCGRAKIDGKSCRRTAGRGTDHPGVGPCDLHDDGAWSPLPFAENADAQKAFLEAVRSSPYAGVRELVEQLGYRRRDVIRLLDSSVEFQEDYVEARGYDLDSLRNAVAKRAIAGESDRMLEFLARMRLPEAAELQRQRFDGSLQVGGVEVKLAFQPSFVQPQLEAGDGDS